jgi:hypothetical protein
MVQDSGGVPLSVKGIVVGLGSKTMDVLWDVPFLSGTTLGGRCSEYRGSTVEFNTCLNLTNPQFIASTKPRPPAPVSHQSPFKPQIGPYPAIQPRSGQQSTAGFRPASQAATNGRFGHLIILKYFFRTDSSIAAPPLRCRSCLIPNAVGVQR